MNDIPRENDWEPVNLDEGNSSSYQGSPTNSPINDNDVWGSQDELALAEVLYFDVLVLCALPLYSLHTLVALPLQDSVSHRERY